MRWYAPELVCALLVSLVLAAGTVSVRAADISALEGVTVAAPGAERWEGFYASVFGGSFSVDGSTTTPLPTNDSDTGFLGGALLGFGVVSDSFVFGIEGDLSLTDARASLGSGGSADFDWFGTIRARAGYAFDDFLVYGTGGFAAAGASVAFPTGTADEILTGYTVGAGVEADLGGNFTARAEYLFSDLGTASGSAGGTPFSAEFDSHTVRAGITYRFD